MTLKVLERGPYGPKINGNLINVIYKDFVTIREVSKKLARVPKTVCYSSRKSSETDIFRKNKIRTRLAQRPTLVVL
jgi:hypothetical protein